jgi:CDP-diglyceride synthetase
VPTGLLVALLAALFDTGLYYIAAAVTAVREALIILLQPPLVLLVRLGLSIGLGMVAVIFLEVWFNPAPIYSGTLWALFLCVLVGSMFLSFFGSTFGLRPLFFPVTDVFLIGTAVGIFWQGRRYWRY